MNLELGNSDVWYTMCMEEYLVQDITETVNIKWSCPSSRVWQNFCCRFFQEILQFFCFFLNNIFTLNSQEFLFTVLFFFITWLLGTCIWIDIPLDFFFFFFKFISTDLCICEYNKENLTSGRASTFALTYIIKQSKAF